MIIKYGSIWNALEPPLHSICVFMRYDFYTNGPKYFTLEVGGNGRSKLLAEDFILKHYKQEKK